MKITLVCAEVIPVTLYGGVERVVWYLGRELAAMGNDVTFLVNEGSSSDFARVKYLDLGKPVGEQIPEDTDIVHFHFNPRESDGLKVPYIVTVHGNRNDFVPYDINSVFVSNNLAGRFGSDVFVYNGMDWEDYTRPELGRDRSYFHFLGKAAWRIKNVQGAIDTIRATKKEKLKVLGGTRINIKMGMRFTISPRIRFHGMVGGEKKDRLVNGSKGLLFPVRWHEPFGLAITESLFYGCPVYATPYGSLPELVNENVGFLSNSRGQLADALENKQFKPETCHDYARDLFNSKIMAESYLALYEKVLNGEPLNRAAPVLQKLQEEKFLEWEI